MISKGLILIILIVVSSLSIVAYFITSSNKKGELVVQFRQELSPNTIVRFNDTILLPSSLDTKRYSDTVRAGKGILEVNSPGYEQYVAELNIEPEKVASITVELAGKDPKSIASESLDFPFDNVVDPVYYGERDWLTFGLLDENGNRIGGIAVAKYEKISNSWVIVEQGSDLDALDARFEGAPNELISLIMERY